MTKRNFYHIVPNGNNWAVKREKSRKSTRVLPTQSEAEQYIKKALRDNKQGGEVRIHRKNGRIRDSDTIAPANDPYPPKDKKH